jgi:hypothetical protein
VGQRAGARLRIRGGCLPSMRARAGKQNRPDFAVRPAVDQAQEKLPALRDDAFAYGAISIVDTLSAGSETTQLLRFTGTEPTKTGEDLFVSMR